MRCQPLLQQGTINAITTTSHALPTLCKANNLQAVYLRVPNITASTALNDKCDNYTQGKQPLQAAVFSRCQPSIATAATWNDRCDNYALVINLVCKSALEAINHPVDYRAESMIFPHMIKPLV